MLTGSGDPTGVRSAPFEREAAACAAIYAPFVRDTTVSFETEVPTASEFAARIGAAVATHAWLVAEHDGEIVGYAYAGPHRTRAAYRWTCEVSVYLASAARGGGLGRALYAALFEVLARRGYVTALAGVTLPNAPSLGLHQALGFEPLGTFRHVGFKSDSWHDVCWLQRSLQPLPAVPAELS